MQGKIFVSAINCMDGRTQEPVNNYLKDKYQADYVDVITEPGPVKIIAERKPDSLIESIKTRLDISINKHGSKVIALVAHHDCAGNPVDKAEQIEQMSKALKNLKELYSAVEVIGLWVGDDWQVEEAK